MVFGDAGGARVVVEGVTVEAEKILEYRFVDEADDAFKDVGEGVVGTCSWGEDLADGRENITRRAEDVAEVVVVDDAFAFFFRLAVVEV